MPSSLLIVGLPRSMTTFVYLRCVEALPHMRPSDHRSGEILRLLPKDLWADYFARDFAECWQESKTQIDNYIDNFIIKDVTNPYLLIRYCREFPDRFKVLRVSRPLPDVVYCWMRRGWFIHLCSNRNYAGCEDPIARLDERGGNYERDMLDGAVEVDTALQELCHTSVDFDDMLAGPEALVAALERLELHPREIEDYTKDTVFRLKRDMTLSIRDTSIWGRLDEAVRADAIVSR